ncbi:hypothetical protein ACQEU6_24510 [Spirillospora sp. CA-108201]
MSMITANWYLPLATSLISTFPVIRFSDRRVLEPERNTAGPHGLQRWVILERAIVRRHGDESAMHRLRFIQSTATAAEPSDHGGSKIDTG